MRTMFLTLAIACTAALCTMTMAVADAPAVGQAAPADGLAIHDITDSDKYEEISFNHSQHGALQCTDCHHTWDGSSEVKKCMESGCHANLSANVKKGAESLYAAYHTRTSTHSCVGCHSAKKKAGEKVGPTSCTKCHALKK